MALPDAETWIDLDRVLSQLLALPPEERNEHLNRLCVGDSRRAAHVRRLLASAERPLAIDRLVESPVFQEALMNLPGPRVGDRLGDWHLRERLGVGGMSEVFLAERGHDGVRQRAALKLLAVAPGSIPVRQRFARECRILARLTDARIARYYDNGVASDGRPWLAMELVDGEPLDRHVERHVPGIEARVRLFLDLVGAVSHAHGHLVVHRDLKPSNVLVTGEGQMKLIDFGIAKALDDEMSIAMTAVDARVLTIEYASPDQLQGGVVNTASDIYQLGVLLYRLITGTHPFAADVKDRMRLMRATLEQEPEPPSRRLRRNGRMTLASQVAGDLDAIILTALAKAPTARYASADSLRADLQAWLNGRPVQARRAGTWERSMKFLRRHRLAVAMTLPAMAIGVALAGAWLSETVKASHAAQTSQAVLALLEQTLNANSYGIAPRPPETVAALLDETEQRARETLAAQPEALVRTMYLVGRARMGRGEYRLAAAVLNRAHSIALYQMEQPVLAGEIVPNLIQSLHYSGDYMAAQRFSIERLADASKPRDRLDVLNSHADLIHSLGDYLAAEGAAREALALSIRLFGADDDVAGHADRQLGMVLRDRGRFVAARQHLERAIRIDRTEHGPHHVNLSVALDHYGQLLLQEGDLEAAEAALSEAASIRNRLYSPGFLSGVWVDHRLALLDLLRNDPDAALAGLNRVVDIYTRDLSKTSHITALAHSDMGWALLVAGRHDEAQAQFDQADRVLAILSHGQHPRRSELLLGRAVIALAQGQRAQAAGLARSAFDLRTKTTDAGHPILASACRLMEAAGGVCPQPVPRPASDKAMAWRQLDLALQAI